MRSLHVRRILLSPRLHVIVLAVLIHHYWQDATWWAELIGIEVLNAVSRLLVPFRIYW